MAIEIVDLPIKKCDFPQLWMTIPWPSLDHVGHQVLVDDEPPPCALLTYVELTNSGGRILRGGGMFGWTGWLGEMGLQYASTMKGFRSQLKFLLQDRIPQVSVRMVFGYQGGALGLDGHPVEIRKGNPPSLAGPWHEAKISLQVHVVRYPQEPLVQCWLYSFWWPTLEY